MEPLEAFWVFLCSLGTPFWTVVLSFCSALLVALLNYRAVMTMTTLKMRETSRHENFSRAVSTAIAEFEGITTAALQGKGNGDPGALYAYICFYVVFHFKLNGLAPPTFEELDEAIEHARDLSLKIRGKYSRTWAN